MAETKTTVRKLATRVLAAGALLALYSVGTLTVTGGLLTATTTTADAQWRGRRGFRGRGFRGRRGWRGRGRYVCRHRGFTSRRVCWWR